MIAIILLLKLWSKLTEKYYYKPVKLFLFLFDISVWSESYLSKCSFILGKYKIESLFLQSIIVKNDNINFWIISISLVNSVKV